MKKTKKYLRSITFDRLSYDDDGYIEEVAAKRGDDIAQLKPLDAFARLEAETFADQRGIEIDFAEKDGARAGVTVTDIHNEDWIGYSQVDFGDGATVFTATVASDTPKGGAIHLFLDGCDVFSNLAGKQIGSCKVSSTGGAQAWTTVTCGIKQTKGVHDLYLRFSGVKDQALFNLDHFRFKNVAP